MLAEMSVVGDVVGTIAWIFLIFLIARFVFEYVFLFARDYTPSGVVLVLVETIYTITDPPLKLLRRFIPPLRLGPGRAGPVGARPVHPHLRRHLHRGARCSRVPFGLVAHGDHVRRCVTSSSDRESSTADRPARGVR